jgi:hypothetical protein
VDEVDRLGVDTERAAGGEFWRRPAASPVIDHLGGGAPDVQVSLAVGGGQGPTPAVAEVGRSAPEQSGSATPPSRWRVEVGQPPSRWALIVHPQAGSVGPPGEEVPGALQDVSSCPWSHHRELFNLFCLLS